MGVIVIYLYALIAFAFMRASFDVENEMYCNTLLQCFVTVLRYGVIGDITDVCLHRGYKLLSQTGCDG